MSARRVVAACAALSLALLAACGTGVRPVPDPSESPALFVSEAEADRVDHVEDGWVRVGAGEDASSGHFVDTAGAPLGTAGTVASIVFDVPHAGAYSLWLRAASVSSVPATVSVGFDHDLRSVLVAPNGAFAWYEATREDLALGEHVITFGAGSPEVHFDLFAVVASPEAEVMAHDLEELVVLAPWRAAPSLRGDPDFDASALSPDVARWHARVLDTIANPGDDLDPMEEAASDDLYVFGRTLQTYVQSVLIAFRMTGDLALLDHLDQITERMRADLRDEWRGTLDGSNGTRDGYVNWVWRYSSGDEFVGKDLNLLDEMKTHAMVAMVATALEANRDLRSPTGRPYAAHADFWKDYLVNVFEAKWREREEVPSGFPVMTRPHMNVYLSWTKWHYYMGELTGSEAYSIEAERMATIWWNEIRPVSTSLGTAYVWPRSVLGIGGSQDSLQPTVYAAGVFADVVELHLAGFHRFAATEEVNRFGRTFTEFVMDTDDPVTNGLSRDIGGGVARAGIWSDGTNWQRMTTHGFWLSGYPLIAAWDSTGRVAEFVNAAYARRGSSVGMMLEVGALLDGMWTDGATLSASVGSSLMR